MRAAAWVNLGRGTVPWLLWGVGMSLAGVTGAVSIAQGRPWPTSVNVSITPMAYLTAGLIAWRRRPDNLTGPLLMTAAIPSLVALIRYLLPVLAALEAGLYSGSVVILAYVLLAFPTGRLTGRAERRAMGLIALAYGADAVATILTAEPARHFPDCLGCPPNPFRVTADLGVYPTLDAIANVVVVLGGAVVLGLIVRRWLRASAPARRMLTPVEFGGIVIGLGSAAQATSQLALPDQVWVPLQSILGLLRLLVPFGLALTLIRLRLTRAAVAEATVELGPSPPTGRLEDVLRGALGDPSLTIGRWSPSANAYLDIEGQRVALPTDGDSRTVTRIDRDDAPDLALVHDAAWLDDVGLIESLGASVRLAVRTSDMQTELRVRGGDPATLPRGDVTFLFGDIEGSTALLESLGERYAELLKELRRLASGIADAHGGRLVDASGDEVFLAFPEATAGVDAAVELSQRLKATAWPGGAVVRLRVGLHTGRPEVTESGYVGLDVHRGARIMAIAHGGQILASAATVAGSRRDGALTIRPLGDYALRGLSEPVALVEIHASADERAFPPPRGAPVR